MGRVVITGYGFYSPLGISDDEVMRKLKSCSNAVSKIDVLEEYTSMNCKLGAKVTADLPNYPRKKVRSMGRVGILATAATEIALDKANLNGSYELKNGSTGIAYGSSGGSASAMNEAGMFMMHKDVSYLNATTYVSMMPHTVAVNLSIFFGIKGRIIATSTACTSGSQAIGYAYECIKSGSQKIMIAGGAEELSPFAVGVFDSMFATTQKNNEPSKTPNPFDKNRDGIVVGEGAGTLVLEDYDHAIARGAKIYAEIVGFATNCDATHITNPSSEDMEKCMIYSLKNASLNPEQIGYVNAHGTGTVNGDIAESQATYRVFGNKTPVATLKSYMGHTLGAAGSLEAIFTIIMQHNNWFAPNINLEEVDQNCGNLNYILGAGLNLDTEYVMSNNFAFGGVNTSLIFKKVNK
ncbi:MAG: beta-ketoacyl-ACP synthase [Succinivibrionaceae bacterium]